MVKPCRLVRRVSKRNVAIRFSLHLAMSSINMISPLHYSVCQTFRCDNSLCRSRDFLHYLPEAKNFKVIKRSENFEVLQTSTK